MEKIDQNELDALEYRGAYWSYQAIINGRGPYDIDRVDRLFEYTGQVQTEQKLKIRKMLAQYHQLPIEQLQVFEDEYLRLIELTKIYVNYGVKVDRPAGASVLESLELKHKTLVAMTPKNKPIYHFVFLRPVNTELGSSWRNRAFWTNAIMRSAPIRGNEFICVIGEDDNYPMEKVFADELAMLYKWSVGVEKPESAIEPRTAVFIIDESQHSAPDVKSMCRDLWDRFGTTTFLTINEPLV